MKKTVSVLSQKRNAGKKKYEVPRLVRYGTVAKLTRGGTGGGSDGGGGHGLHTKHCWIAEALYGVDAPRTHLVRAWLTECYERREPWSLVVVPLYRRFGQRVAAFLRSHPAFKGLFRPLFDLGVRRAHRDRAADLLTLAVAAEHICLVDFPRISSFGGRESASLAVGECWKPLGSGELEVSCGRSFQ